MKFRNGRDKAFHSAVRARVGAYFESSGVTRYGVTLRPQVRFGDDMMPGANELRQLHDQAHHVCFIADSVKTEVVVKPQ